MKKINVLSSALLIAMGVQPVSATILTFSDLQVLQDDGSLAPASGIFQLVHDDYGDNVVTTSDHVGSYLKGAGFTPNIKTSYDSFSTITDEFKGNTMWFDNSGAGDLEDMLYTQQSYGEITLTPENGYAVVLNSFEMGAQIISDRPIDTLQVLDANRAVLWDANVTTIRFKIDGVRSHETFSPNISSEGAITIRWGIEHKPTTWLAIDTINFDQKVVGGLPSTGNNGCTAQYHADGTLVIPCVSVPNGVGGEVIYQASMKMKPLTVPPVFELQVAELRGVIVDACMARYQLNGHLELPCVSLPDGSMYKANMQIKPSSNPMAFELTDAQPK
jgi:hypothetical protein